jgi:hypothetical protein
MIKGDVIELFGHEMEVMVRKESLDLIRYDMVCRCHSYPRNLVIEATEKMIEEFKKLKK